MKSLKFTLIVVFLVSLILFSFNLSFAQQNCQVARPWFGSINCEEYPDWSQEISVPDDQTWACNVPTCEISRLDSFKCNVFGTLWKGLRVTRGSSTILDCSTDILDANSLTCKTGDTPLPLHAGDIIAVDFWCKGLLNEYNPANVIPNIYVRYKPIKLNLHYDSGYNFQSGTEGCKINPVWTSYYSKQPADPSRLQQLSSSINVGLFSNSYGSMVPSGSDIIGTLTPKDLTAGQGYWLVYDWVTRPDLIVKYYQDIPVWCNVQDHSLTKFESITTQSGSCYLIPTSRLPQTVDCCSTDECKLEYSDQSIQCTDDFKCGYTKSCLSDIDCGSTSTCESSNGNYYVVKSSCDKSKPDSYGKGKCVSSKEQVQCCTGDDGGPNVCGTGKYCDYSKGCQLVLQKCPSNACCKSGGQYIPQDCPSGLQCCIGSNSFVGECKESCQPKSEVKNEPETGITPTGMFASTGSIIAGFIIAAIIIVVVAWKKGYLHFERGTKTITPVKELKPKVKKIPKTDVIFCTQCGSEQSKDTKFCTNCGNKLE